MKYLYLLAVGIFLVETAVIIAMGKLYRMLAEENDELQADVKKQKENLSLLVNYSDEVARIYKSENDTTEKLKECKTDEEIADVIAGIISANNNRVRNDQ